ncbi:MAG: DNA methyltransferase [Planctomycetota bacterium]
MPRRIVTTQRSAAAQHAEWIRLLEVSGPFLELPVLTTLFPQGLPTVDATVRADLRARYDEWAEAKPDDRAIHTTWIRSVLRDVLGFPPETLRDSTQLAVSLHAHLPEHRTTLGPDYAIVEPATSDSPEHPRLLVQTHPRTQDLERTVPDQPWKATPLARMVELLRRQTQKGDHQVRLGLVTNGEQWTLVHVQPGEASTFATWRAELFSPEPLTLQAFTALLGVERTIGSSPDNRLEALFQRSASASHELTDQLGLQVRQAVERLVKGVDDIDRARNRQLLRGLPEKELYEAAVTVMMRLVFVFYAEENRLLPLDDAFYQQHYALSPLRDQLEADREKLTDDVLQRRHAAWCRLLATFRAVHGGVEHEAMRLPAYGGNLFDPDRFPFLEGRQPTSRWRDTEADPLEIDDLTVLHLLQSLQSIEVAGTGKSRERRPLSFRSLDVEQIGHVYEGLLDHTAVRAKGPVLGLVGKKGEEPEVDLAELEAMAVISRKHLVGKLEELTQKSAAATEKLLGSKVAEESPDLWRRACGGDEKLLQSLAPYAGLVRIEHDAPVVFPAGSVYVTKGSDRRSTGTHYTPRSLTEPIVEHALDPLVYVGPAEGKPEAEWVLRSPREILSLKVCDMTVGSGAFLVQACRYLADRLVESWAQCEAAAPDRVLVSPEGDLVVSSEAQRALPKDDEERLALARRAVADRCLYGVDVNAMAVEMAKLSLWLVTLQKDRPFTFLDHAIRVGDSLLGVSDPEQLATFHLDPVRGRSAHGIVSRVDEVARRAIEQAVELRTRLESFPVLDVRDAERKKRLLEEAQGLLADLVLAADLLVGAGLVTAGKPGHVFDSEVQLLGGDVEKLLAADVGEEEKVRLRARLLVKRGQVLGGPEGKARRPFHWALEFPEVFSSPSSSTFGFDCILGNPPFLGGTLATTQLGQDYCRHIGHALPPYHGKADYGSYFFKQGVRMLQARGILSLLCTASLLRGETADTSLVSLIQSGYCIPAARAPFPWPGDAKVTAVVVSLTREPWHGARQLDGKRVPHINASLAHSVAGQPHSLVEAMHGYMGIKVSPANPTLSALLARAINTQCPNACLPKIGGKELYNYTDLAEAHHCLDPVAASHYTRLAEIVKDIAGIAIDPTDIAHSAPARELGSQLSILSLCFACAETSHVQLVFRHVSTPCILTHKTIAVPSESWATFGLLQSIAHELWAWQYGLRRKQDLTYSIKRCLATFPLPPATQIASLESISKEVHAARDAASAANGLSDFYHSFHRGHLSAKAVREGQVEIDRQVLAAYGWGDLRLDHDFRGSGKDTRFTVSDPIRQELLDRLLELNHARHAVEARPQQTPRPPAQRGLFDSSDTWRNA